MLSNVYSKQEILDELAKKGYFVDAYTLDTFFEQRKIEAIYEDEESKEFFDKNTLDIILENLFKKEEEDGIMNEENSEVPKIDVVENEASKVQEEAKQESPVLEDTNEEAQEEVEVVEETEEPEQVEEVEEEAQEEIQQEEFDDMSLISDSFEAQEQFRQYVVSQLSKNNVDLTPKNEFKLDISEHTLNMIAKTLAKKITKYVGTICAADARVQVQLEEAQAKNSKLEDRVESLEEQNKKLRMLLTESNRNLNSYKPGLFGFYIKTKTRR